MAPLRTRPEAAPARGWRPQRLLLAPHRLGFFAAVLVLAASGLGWLAVLWARAAGSGWALAVPSAVAHPAVMVAGFMPLFFTGFVFTAAPRWLAVPPWPARALAWSVSAQAAGWLTWLAGCAWSGTIAAAGATLAACGLAAAAWRLRSLIARARKSDRLHASIVCAGLAVGAAAVAALAVATAGGRWDIARACVLSALWGCIVPVFLAAAHRLLPFLTSDALPLVRALGPSWPLSILLATALLQAFVPWLPVLGWRAPVAHAAAGCAQALCALLVLRLSAQWRAARRPWSRLVAMLHAGFTWLGLAFLVSAASTLLSLGAQQELLPQAGVHVLAIGALGSWWVAMVDRVSCAHSGRAARVAGRLTVTVFLALQAALALRLAADFASASRAWLLVAAAACWALPSAAWSWRLAHWYGRAGPDGRAG